MAKTTFSSKLGVLLAAAGSAVGLGSIWKFPYVVGQNGGGAFILLYLACSFILGLPLVMNEFQIGQKSGKSVYGAYRALRGNGRWQWLAWMNVITLLLIMSFYAVVTGWCINYLFEAMTNTFAQMDANALSAHFQEFEMHSLKVILYAVIAVVLTGAVLWFDVSKGIERMTKILMPLLFVIMLALAIYMLCTCPNTSGYEFLFRPDFSKITPQVFLEALGLSVFTLSIGVGILITYGSYMVEGQKVASTSIQMIALTIMVALLAGMVIFPAVFAYGFSPAEGPQLIFVTLPMVFQHMWNPALMSSVFFFLVLIAALTSTISMMEVPIAFLCEATAQRKRPLNRHQSAIIVSVVIIALSILVVLAPQLFDIFNALTSNILMPLGALAISVFTGWFAPQALYQGSPVGAKIYRILLRWVLPIAILVVFLNSLNII
ncbi:MAG: sodium-dependent transporter [Paludibacteraceae bacterium]|nr:sodium-dependent transporter [Paludibacteraceae bacterium]